MAIFRAIRGPFTVLCSESCGGCGEILLQGGMSSVRIAVKKGAEWFFLGADGALTCTNKECGRRVSGDEVPAIFRTMKEVGERIRTLTIAARNPGFAIPLLQKPFVFVKPK